MTYTPDFVRMSLREALGLAIAIEEDARERYEELAAQLEYHHTDAAAEFFRFMAQQEKTHAEELRLKHRRLFGDEADPAAPPVAQLEGADDLEAPSYNAVRVYMSVRSAFEASERAKHNARDFFAKALELVHDPAVHRFFDALRDEEEDDLRRAGEHFSGVSDEYDDDWYLFVDDPVGQ